MLKILVADDHELVRVGLRDLLQTHAGWEVCGEASDGDDAVGKAAEMGPDVAILDARMPGIGGIQATRQIRATSPRTEVMILTGHRSEQVLSDAVAAGAHAVVLKGQDATEIIRAVEALADHRTFIGTGLPRLGPGDGAMNAPRSIPGAGRLTPRQSEIAKLLAEGKTNWCIAAILGISVKTVETHRATILEKLDLESVVELVHYAIRNFMIDP